MGSVCTLKDRQIRFTEDFIYKTDKTIILDSSKLKCLNTNYAPCMIYLNMTGGNSTYLELKNGSEIQGKQVIV